MNDIPRARLDSASAPSDLEIVHGLPESQRLEAARLYLEAFRTKLAPVLGPDEIGLRLLAEAFDPGRAIVALRDERLVGVLGLNHGGRRFANLRPVRLVREYGRINGWARALLAAMLEREDSAGQLLLDGIAVDRDARGGGVGTLLLMEVSAYAVRRGFRSVRLDVVNTNEQARRLYQRLGFSATRTTRVLWPLNALLGFSAVTTMVKTLEK
jgi:GNAT superfamily N-acetyltransferase